MKRGGSGRVERTVRGFSVASALRWQRGYLTLCENGFNGLTSDQLLGGGPPPLVVRATPRRPGTSGGLESARCVGPWPGPLAGPRVSPSASTIEANGAA